MRTIAAPEEDPQVVYQCCVDSIADNNLRNRLSELTSALSVTAVEYNQKGVAKELYTLQPNNCRNNEIAMGVVTKQELKDVYSTHMLGKAKPARLIYDSLLSRAPLGRCPFCGMGHASTLDHYLPKTKYPQFSVVPLNLVPSCKDCNTGKSTAVANTAGTQSLHPYFDGQHFIYEQWLFAEFDLASETISYFVRAPEPWDEISRKRVQSHFRDFKLARRFAIEAANELATQKHFLEEFKRKNGTGALVDLLLDQAKSNYKKHVNSWQTAFYQALHKHNLAKKAIEDLTEICPICDGEGVFVNYACPCCEGNRFISKSLMSKINISDYDNLKCPECEGRTTCHLCCGKGSINRENVLRLTKSRP